LTGGIIAGCEVAETLVTMVVLKRPREFWLEVTGARGGVDIGVADWAWEDGPMRVIVVTWAGLRNSFVMLVIFVPGKDGEGSTSRLLGVRPGDKMGVNWWWWW